MFSEYGTGKFHPDVLAALNLGVVFDFSSNVMRVGYGPAKSPMRRSS